MGYNHIMALLKTQHHLDDFMPAVRELLAMHVDEVGLEYAKKIVTPGFKYLRRRLEDPNDVGPTLQAMRVVAIFDPSNETADAVFDVDDLVTVFPVLAR